MRDALVVLNARDVPECLGSLSLLDIDKIFLRGWTEARIEDVAFPQVLEMDYDWLWVVSDDVIVRSQALDAVREHAGYGEPVTGYSQRSHTEWTVNLTRGPLYGDAPSVEAYDFHEYREVVAKPETLFRTWFTGMSLTGMPIALWRRFPFACFRDDVCSFGSDFSLSLRLQEAGIRINAVRDAFCYHWRHRWQDTTHALDQKPVVGQEKILLVDAHGLREAA